MRVDSCNYSSVDLDNLPINNDWDGRDVSENLMHRIHAYPAKFPAFITTKAIQFAESKAVHVETVADIFCGCGTVAYETVKANRHFWGCDINPVATLIARTKSRHYDNERLATYYWKFRRKVTPFFSYERDPLCPIESDPLVLKAEPSIECRLVRFLVPTACISNSDERKG